MEGHKGCYDVIRRGNAAQASIRTKAHAAGPVGADYPSDLAVPRFGFVALPRPPDGASVPGLRLPFGGVLPMVMVLMEELGVS